MKPESELTSTENVANQCIAPTCSAAAIQGIGRRSFLMATAASVTTVLLSEIFPGRVTAEDLHVTAQLATFPAVKIGQLSALRNDDPQTCSYPNAEVPNSDVTLVKLGRQAGGGIGPDQDVVAFSALCTHMGGTVDGYSAKYKLGGCSQHLTTFDLTRHGMVVAGHATEALPQIVLELRGDDIYAIGIVGLLFGHFQNPQ